MKKFVIFDLDGTLIDTVEGIKEAVNKYLIYRKIDLTYDKKQVASFLGNGARMLFKRMMKDNQFNEEDYLEFLEFYKNNQKESKVYDGVVDTLKKITKRNYELYILSNKPDNLLQLITKELLNDIDFKYVQGENKNYQPKPDVTLLNEKIINNFNLNSKDGYYVGDSYVDILTGQNAKLKTILVTYGYGKLDEAIKYKPDYIVNKFDEIKEILK